MEAAFERTQDFLNIFERVVHVKRDAKAIVPPGDYDISFGKTCDDRFDVLALQDNQRAHTGKRRLNVNAELTRAGVRVALFIDPERAQIEGAARAGAPVVELHTGAYAQASGGGAATELERLRVAARLAASLGLTVHAGHGLNYHNVQPVAAIAEISELNIGHALIAHALFVGLPAAVREMKALLAEARA